MRVNTQCRDHPLISQSLLPSCGRIAQANADPSPQNTSYRDGREVVQDNMESVLNFKALSVLAIVIQIVSLGASVATANAETGVASVYSTESGSQTASGARLKSPRNDCRAPLTSVRIEGSSYRSQQRALGARDDQRPRRHSCVAASSI